MFRGYRCWEQADLQTVAQIEAGAFAHEPHEFVERERDRCCGGVAVMVDGDHQPLARQAEPFRRGFEDAHVRLVRDQPVDVLELHVRRLDRLARRFLQHANGELEHRLPVHFEERCADDRATAHVAGDI